MLALKRGLSSEVLQDRACSETLDAALRVHGALGPGHAAETYKNALAVELRARDLAFHREPTFSVAYRERVVGTFIADLVVEDRVLVQIAAEPVLSGHHKTETLRGIVAGGVKVGLAFNFGGPDLSFARIL